MGRSDKLALMAFISQYKTNSICTSEIHCILVKISEAGLEGASADAIDKTCVIFLSSFEHWHTFVPSVCSLPHYFLSTEVTITFCGFPLHNYFCFFKAGFVSALITCSSCHFFLLHNVFSLIFTANSTILPIFTHSNFLKCKIKNGPAGDCQQSYSNQSSSVIISHFKDWCPWIKCPSVS